MLRLYDRERSGNCYRVRLFLSVLNISYERIPVTRTGKEPNRLPEGFDKFNPRGQIPVLIAEGQAIWDSHAILSYLARRYANEEWFPSDPQGLASVIQWFALNLDEGTYGLARARSIRGQRREGNLEDALARARTALSMMETRLAIFPWLASRDRPTIADIACYPYTAMSPEAGISLTPYPGIRQWAERIKALPGYISLPQYDGSG